MFFDSRPIPLLPVQFFNNHEIEWVKEFKYLGLLITNKMSFALHINNIISKISRFNGIFYNLRTVVPFSILKMLFFSFVLPHILLHIEIWGAAPVVHTGKLHIKINKLIRSLLGVRYVEGRPTVDTKSMYQLMGALKLENLFKVRMFRLLALLLNGSNPDLFQMLLRPYEITHSYHTRNTTFRHPLLVNEIQRRAGVKQLF
ncbi:MAG: hypothetical protein AAFP20_25800, partial [Cyanobacteria bacterium J06614_10]